MDADILDKKILMVTPSYDPVIGGTEIAVKNFSRELINRGVHVDILTYNMDTRWKSKKESCTEIRDGISIKKIGGSNVFLNNRLNFINKLLFINIIPRSQLSKHMNNYDIIHFHDDVDLSLPLTSAFLKKPKIFHYHTLQRTYNFYRMNYLSRHVLKRIFSKHICNSTSSQSLLEKIGIDQKLTKVVYNGVNTELFVPDFSKKTDNLLLYVGRIQKNKGLHDLLRSVKYIQSKIKIMIIGPVYNEEYFKKIESYIKKLKDKGIEIDYIGSLSNEKLVEWYQKATIFICPSLQESLGIINLESLSCSTPVIASKVGGIPEIIRQGYNGVLFPPGDARALAEAVNSLLEDENKLKKFGINGRKTVLKNFSWPVVTEDLINVYREMV